jgi:hypothetical protein
MNREIKTLPPFHFFWFDIPVSLLGYEDVRADLERLKTITAPAG